MSSSRSNVDIGLDVEINLSTSKALCISCVQGEELVIRQARSTLRPLISDDDRSEPRDDVASPSCRATTVVGLSMVIHFARAR
jgi:hypothetical protein